MADLKLADLKMTDQTVRKMGDMKLAHLSLFTCCDRSSHLGNSHRVCSSLHFII